MGLLAFDRWCCGANHAIVYKVHLFKQTDTRGYKFDVRTFSSRRSVKRLVRDAQEGKTVTEKTNKNISNESSAVGRSSYSGEDNVQDESKLYASDDSATQNSITVASRSNVLQACTVTSGLIAALGVIIREASHAASVEGLPIPDCSVEISFGFETWHLELIAGLVILVSSCRYLLLKTWPDFAESSEAANQQVLSSLEPLDYLVVASLPGISEELLFRGALLPLFGTNWTGVLVAAAVFGFLHLGSGRKYSFAIWATVVGLVYGYAAVASASVLVPMASHAMNNLVGGLLWRYNQNSSK